uniref:Uncharacterized protein n=1 Tax=Anguilla anguilla TaxID=7936 RepID=A0A0E9U2R7_ANGAN
MLQSRLRLI